MQNDRELGKTRFFKDDFGYCVAFPNGVVKLVKHSAIEVLSKNSTIEDLKPYLLETLSVRKDFHFAAPLIVWLEVTKECNLRCKHCFTNSVNALPNELSTEEIFSLLEELADMGVFAIVLTGGEPTTHPDICKIIQKAKSLGFVISLATNGFDLSSELLEVFPKKDSFISISLDGFEAQKELRPGTTKEFVIERLDLLKKYDIQSSIMTTISHGNIDEVIPLIEWSRDRGIVARTVPFSPIGRGKENKDELLLKNEDLKNTAMAWALETEFELKKNLDYGICVGHLYDFCLSFIKFIRMCKGGRTLAYITSTGETFPCSNASGGDILSAGNIKNGGFAGLWKNSFKEIRSFVWDDFEECKGCEFSGKDYTCTNRCPPLSLLIKGRLKGCGARTFDKKNMKLRNLYLNNILNNKPIEDGIPANIENSCNFLDN